MSPQNKLIIAVDGPAGAGKSSTSKALAKKLGYEFIDTGAMYRALAVHIIDSGVNLENQPEVDKVVTSAVVELTTSHEKQTVLLNGKDVSLRIRTEEITKASSPLSQIPSVRKKLIDLQREMGKNGGVVLEGRDIGTVVFPKADLKLFVTASIEQRAQRRKKELEAKGITVNFAELKNEIEERDERDSNRAESPLKQASDAILLDTSDYTFIQQVEEMFRLAQEKIGNLS